MEQTAEEISPAVSLSDIAEDILALDRSITANEVGILVEDYIGEHTSNIHAKIVDMLASQNYKPLRDYLGVVYAEAYETRDMLAEGC